MDSVLLLLAKTKMLKQSSNVYINIRQKNLKTYKNLEKVLKNIKKK